ncbi:imidazole glycerol phosphate synthase subunit HisH [Tessaracoccus sp. OH4464_COT-324]|nr:imidazole glycerol phosphate synthase subunit HisH [Tessaracoccus sp. OH4464_COT-324]
MGILDYGSGNLHSAAKAFEHVGAQVLVSSRLEELGTCEALVVPGVGAFSECMRNLNQVGGVDYIRGWVAKQRPLFGICVGHQVLFTSGLENGTPTPGVGLFDGVVSKLVARRVPHMGWNIVDANQSSQLFDGLGGERFYFVHSYAVQQGVMGAAYATHDGVRFVAAVEHAGVASTQFHPEKSGQAGLQLLENWLRLI